MKARKVRESTLELVSQHVDCEDVYVTKTIEQSDQSLDEIIQKRYPLVLCGGGDGTAMRIIEQMHLKIAKHNKAGGDYVMPKFGLLKLGTGNGWAGQLATPPTVKPIWTIRKYREDQLQYETFNLMQGEDRVFHFGGFGYDSLILNDYINFKGRFNKGFGWTMANSLFGYLAAIVVDTIPTVVFKDFKINVRVVNNSKEPVYKVSHSAGAEELPLKKGDTIFEGPVAACSFGTTTDFGFRLRVFPFAKMKPGYFQMRLSDASAGTALSNIVPLWRGDWEHPQLYDFLAKDVSIEMDKPMPMQLGGDPEGDRDRLDVKTADFTVDVLDFRKL
jgi:diacylglycerol kinase family enzyme